MKKLLLIEDAEVWSATLTMKLGRWYEIEQVSTDDEALDILASFEPDVLITGYYIEGEHNGLEILRMACQQRPELLPVLFTVDIQGLDLPAQVEDRLLLYFEKGMEGLEEMIAALKPAT